ncbi:hypothetical protein C8R41DRAFT_923619 [Lentinula lateritia]|uniref:F-box domain-containing protein n=1 Tax=Lentinula lateritia TaxID=40482 RepID=A0ABQ8V9J7_9AGAR|nr:hypothetical protein C8R41DRAFT_923619 [Lentinula lateritia]
MASREYLPLDLLENITNHLSPVDLESFGRCCHLFRQHTTAYKNRVFCIERAYRGIFDDVKVLKDFQNLQTSTGLIVSGSTALRFFTRVEYGGDLDCYCHLPQAIESGLWFLAHDFLFTPTGDQLDDFAADFTRLCKLYDDETPLGGNAVEEDIRDYKLDNIASVWNFKRGSLIVQLMGTLSSPLTTILSFHSTCVMNILSHDAAYCLFPNLTLERRASLLINLTLPMTEVQATAVNKYSQRGFDILRNAPTSSTCNPNSAVTFLRPRFVGDRHCHKITFKNLTGNANQGNFIEANSWGMTYLRKFNSTTTIDIDIACATPYIAFTGDILDIQRHLRAVDGLIERQLLSDETALLTIQTLISQNARRPHPASFPWHALNSVMSILRGRTAFSFTSTVAHMLYEFFCIIDKTCTSCPSIDVSLSTNTSHKSVLTISLDIMHPKRRIDWDDLREKALYFADDNILFNIVCDF